MSTDHVYRRATIRSGPPPGARVAGEWGQVVTPEELTELLGVPAEDAARVAELVQIVVEAYCWPNVIEDPVPPPVHLVGLTLASRFGGATLTKAGALVGESVGTYSYRLAQPLTYDGVLELLGTLASELNPWAPRHSDSFTLNTWPEAPIPWPVDWWQRDYDQLVGGWPT